MRQTGILKAFLLLACWGGTVALSLKTVSIGDDHFHHINNDSSLSQGCDCTGSGDDTGAGHDVTPPVFNFTNQTYQLSYHVTNVSGYAAAVTPGSLNEVLRASDVLGQPDGNGAKIQIDGMLTVKLKDMIPAGTQYRIHWRQETGQRDTSRISVSESKELSRWTENSGGMLSTVDENYFSTPLTASIDLRYIRISARLASCRIDAITYKVSSADTMLAILIPNDTIDCTSDYPIPLVTDDCDGRIDVDYTDSVSAGACALETVIYRRYIATDQCGNSAYAFQTIVLADNKAPVIGGDASRMAFDTVVKPEVYRGKAFSIAMGFSKEVRGANNALGMPDASGAIIDNGGKLTLMLADKIPAGTPYQIHWRKEQGAEGVAVLNILESGETSAWLTNNAAPLSATNEDYFISNLVAEIDTRYIKMWNQSAVSLRVDAITYSLPRYHAVVHGTLKNDTIPSSTSQFDVMTAIDNCDMSPALTYSDVKTGQYLTRTWTAHDGCGNTAALSQTMLLIDAESGARAGESSGPPIDQSTVSKQ